MTLPAWILLGCLLWFVVRCLLMGLYTVDQNERAVKTVFGRAQRVEGGKTTLDDAVAERLRPEERERYSYPQVRVKQPVVHVMAYFVSVLRQKIASFEAKPIAVMAPDGHIAAAAAVTRSQ